MYKAPLKFPTVKSLTQGLFTALFTSSMLLPNFSMQPAVAQVMEFCQLSPREVKEKEDLRLSALKGNKNAQNRYQTIIQQHSQKLQDCRRRNWPQTQAIWLRLYPCDTEPGKIDQIMDQIVNTGYNQVYLEAFYDGQVLLPVADNSTVWPSVLRTKGKEKVDLLAAGIKKAKERNLKVYAWMFTMNFGYTYGQIESRKNAIARNGKGQNSIEVVDNRSQVFVDPYNPQAKTDYYRLVEKIMRRNPDGILFDYVRYPRQAGSDSIATKVSDLWLYTPSTQQALFRRAKNSKGLELIRRFLRKGYVTVADVSEIDELYPQEDEPMWEGRIPPVAEQKVLTTKAQQQILQKDLWLLTVAHAMQGILDFVNLASYPAKQRNIPAGVVFFPYGNQTVGKGYDSRLQPWDRFSNNLEWHPMSYATCGKAGCIMEQVQRVLSMAKPDTKVIPALAGQWGKPITGRPSLEVQMAALRRYSSRINAVSHFSYSWQHPEQENKRKFCRN
ncbi:MAG: family 10 glycosylhydrolase [Sphaerospermopsis sp. SIO1G1]|nr:family 10 glycosylhydrolase [Sphaerospermopsis sp. SIO1G1]